LLGADPVFVDIDPVSFNLDPEQLEKHITPKTKAIIPVSLYGQCADYDAINAIANKHNLSVIEDAAQSFGATYKGRKSCGLTTISTTSFFPSKPLGAYGDGGAVFTNDSELAKIIRKISLHGQEKRYEHNVQGINSRLDTIQAAILLQKMKLFPEEVALRAKVADFYRRELEGCDGIITPVIEDINQSAWAQYTIRLESRFDAEKKLKELEIPYAVHYPISLTRQPVFQGRSDHLIHCDQAANEVLSLPMHPYLRELDQQRIVKAIVTN